MSDLGEALPTGTITEATETVVAPTEEATAAAQPAPPPAPEPEAPLSLIHI